MDTRTIEQKKRHYEIEKELARTLKSAAPSERTVLYGSVYKELYARVPEIPHLLSAGDRNARFTDVQRLLRFLDPFLAGKQSFLEIGPGDFSLSIAVSQIVPKVYAVDVTDEIRNSVSLPSNVSS